MGWWDSVWPVVAALIPSAGRLFLFYVIMKRIVEADRRERAAERQWAAERAAGVKKPDNSAGTET